MLGIIVCFRFVKCEISYFLKNSFNLFNDVVKDVIENNYLVIFMIDDWIKVYIKR